MALGSVLVDRARVIRQEPQGEKVEGTTQYEDTAQGWFRARLFLGGYPEGQTSPMRKRVTQTPSLLLGWRDSQGLPVDVRASDRIEVESADLGEAVWEAASDPEPIRKRRRVIGYQVNLRHVKDNEAERLPE